MNKSEFISAVAEKSGLSKVDAKKAVEAFVDTVSNELKEGGKVALLGFGSFSDTENEPKPSRSTWLRFILCVREGRS